VPQSAPLNPKGHAQDPSLQVPPFKQTVLAQGSTVSVVFFFLHPLDKIIESAANVIIIIFFIVLLSFYMLKN
jgi:hypothetical protein